MQRSAPVQQPRFGFTVTRQIGMPSSATASATLKAAIRDVIDHARRDFDYVLIARQPALTSGYDALVADLVKALDRVHRAAARGR
jgi:RNase P protein component